MLTRIAEGVFVHESEFIHSNTTVVVGTDGVLLVDPGITRDDLTDLADDLAAAGMRVVAGFSTHPDWDHVLWDARFGDVPRYATAEGAAAIRQLLSRPDWESQLADALPPEHAHDIPLDLFGHLTPLPEGADRIPWDGPVVRILPHRAHAQGHAALLVDERHVLVAGDMLSDILIPFLDLEAADPLGDYLAALTLFDSLLTDDGGAATSRWCPATAPSAEAPPSSGRVSLWTARTSKR
jgi:glyoxylase-like metal-dependent hydrolase (beta-lactamase superfamily II)